MSVLVASLFAASTVSAPVLLNPLQIVSPSEFPPSLREAGQGAVDYVLTVDAQGKAQRCEIRASSGAADADNFTCLAALARSKLKPARDDHGQPVPGTITRGVRWEDEYHQTSEPSSFPADVVLFVAALPPIRKGSGVMVDVLMDENGTGLACAPTAYVPENKALQPAVCKALVGMKSLPAVLDGQRKPVRGVRNLRVNFAVSAKGAP